MAMRVERAYTKKNKIAKFEGNYHGQRDFALLSTRAAGYGTAPHPLPRADCAGILKCVLENVIILPY